MVLGEPGEASLTGHGHYVASIYHVYACTDELTNVRTWDTIHTC